MLLQLTASTNKVPGLGKLGRELALSIAFKNRVYDFTEPSTAELRWQPSAFEERLIDSSVFGDERIAKVVGQGT